MKIEINDARWLDAKRIKGERWRKTIIPGYKISGRGRVLRESDNKILRAIEKKEKGYLRVRIEHKFYYIHRLVALAYIPNPDNKPMVDHINAIPSDNRIENLRWVTNSENALNPISTKKRRIRRPRKDGKPSRGVAI